MPTALIAEDEPMLRAQLKARLAAAWPELEIVAEAGNGEEALGLAHAQRPDIAFLDIRMPILSGLEVARELASRCHVVFVTAYDEYSLRAFEVNALDYLLKPVAPERLAVTVNRLAAAQPPPPTREMVTYEDRLFLRLGQERAFVRVRDIVAIEAEGDGSTLCLAPHLTRKPSSKSLREWEQRLPDRQFVRIHRSTIVNLDYVDRLEPWSHASQHVYLRGLP